MYIDEAQRLIRTVYRLQLATGRRFSIELQSGPGLGKSEMIKQLGPMLAKDLGLDPLEFAVKSCFLTTMEQPDVRGFGLPAKDTDGAAIMQYTRAPWMPRATDPKHGILNLDEFRQGGHDVQKPAAELLLNGAVGESQLPITYMVVACSNRESDRSGVNRELAFITNRRMVIQIEPNLNAWVKWAERPENNIHWAAIAYAKHMPADIFQDKVPDKPGPFATPRSLVQASFLIGQLDDKLMGEACQGLLGEGTGAKFVAFLRVAESLPKYEDIVADPKRAKVPDADRPDAQFATMQMVAHRCDADTVEPAFEYLMRLPREFQIAALQTVLHRTPAITTVPQFRDWLTKNATLVANANVLGNK
jgi:hypothetical protein